MTSSPTPRMQCAEFEAQLEEFLEGALSVEQRSAMDAHRLECTQCATLVADLDAIVVNASAMPALSPSRDLWPDIEARINTPVVSLDGRVARVAQPRTFSVRTFAAAAVVLIAASSGATWMIARARNSDSHTSSTSTVAASSPVPQLPTAATVPAAVERSTAAQAPQRDLSPGEVAPSANELGTNRARLASRGNDDVARIYEREILAMRRVVNERLDDLDSTTVAEVERNLHIIDKAIEDSRRALDKDPRSRFLSTQLDRALENKLSIMRRVALL